MSHCHTHQRVMFLSFTLQATLSTHKPSAFHDLKFMSHTSTSHVTRYNTSCQCVAMCCSVLQCVAVCCSVLQCYAVCHKCELYRNERSSLEARKPRAPLPPLPPQYLPETGRQRGVGERVRESKRKSERERERATEREEERDRERGRG